MVEAFSLLAVGTSLIGTLLSFSQFFKEQLNNNNTFNSPPEQTAEVVLPFPFSLNSLILLATYTRVTIVFPI